MWELCAVISNDSALTLSFGIIVYHPLVRLSHPVVWSDFLILWCEADPCPGGVLPIWWVIHMCRGFDPLFWSSGYQTRSFWGVFSHPPTQKRSFGYKSSQNSIFLAPKYHFPLDLFGSNFQWPTAHTQKFSDRVPLAQPISWRQCVL